MRRFIRAIGATMVAAAVTAALAVSAAALYTIRVPTTYETTIRPYKCGDNCEYTFDESTGTLTIKGKGKMTDYGNENQVPWRKHADKIVSAVFEEGITNIGSYSFAYCKKLVSIVIPSTVDRISECAFYHCDALPHVLLPNNVQYIENMAFGETGLTTITFEGSPIDIHNQAFCLVGRINPCIVYCPEQFDLTWRMKTPKEWYGGYFNFSYEDNYRD